MYAGCEANAQVLLVKDCVIVFEEVDAEDPQIDRPVRHDANSALMIFPEQIALFWHKIRVSVDDELQIGKVLILAIAAIAYRNSSCSQAFQIQLLLEIEHEDVDV